IMRYTVPTVHNSLGLKISPYVQPWCSRSDVQWVSRLPCEPLTVTCHCKPAARVHFLFPTQYVSCRSVTCPSGTSSPPVSQSPAPSACPRTSSLPALISYQLLFFAHVQGSPLQIIGCG
ncbi:MAG: hypothetical protein ACK55Z_21475, partial [bacterium]